MSRLSASVLTLAFVAASTALTAAVPAKMNYQGRLTLPGAGPVPDSTGNTLVFRIFDAATLGTQLWTETWNSGTSCVTTTNGLFNVELGKYSSLGGLAFDIPYFLEIQVNADPSPLSPRQPLTTAPYAFKARTFEFPQDNSVNLAAPAFKLNNVGSGNAIEGHANAGGATGVFAKNSVSGGRALYSEGSALFTTNGSPSSVSFATHVDFSGATVTGLALGVGAPLSLTLGSGVSAPLYVSNHAGASAISATANTASASDAAVIGYNLNASGAGIRGTGGAYGVFGNAGATGTGVWGQTSLSGTNSGGVYGFNGNSGAGIGVLGRSSGTGGMGVVGSTAASPPTAGTTTGVYGYTTSGYGVYGRADQASSYGVRGESTYAAASGYGVLGTIVNGNTGGAGVVGSNTSGFPGPSFNVGVYGVNTQNSGIGVFARNSGGNGEALRVSGNARFDYGAVTFTGQVDFAGATVTGLSFAVSAPLSLTLNSGVVSPLSVSNASGVAAVFTGLSPVSITAYSGGTALAIAGSNGGRLVDVSNSFNGGVAIYAETVGSGGRAGQFVASGVGQALKADNSGTGYALEANNSGTGDGAYIGSSQARALWANAPNGTAILAQGGPVALSATSFSGRAVHGRNNGSNPTAEFINDGSGAPLKLNALSFPSGSGTNGQVLITNGSSQMSWADAPAPIAPLSLTSSGVPSTLYANNLVGGRALEVVNNDGGTETIRAQNNAGSGNVIYALNSVASANSAAIFGHIANGSLTSIGVYGYNGGNGYGVQGSSSAGVGGFFSGVTGVAATSSSSVGTALYGANSATTGSGHGVIGTNSSVDGFGVVGRNFAVAGVNPPAGVGGFSMDHSQGMGGFFVGNGVGVKGQPNAASGIGVLADYDLKAGALGLKVKGPSEFEGLTFTPALAPVGNGRIIFDNTTGKFKASQSGGAYVDLVAGAVAPLSLTSPSSASTVSAFNNSGGNGLFGMAGTAGGAGVYGVGQVASTVGVYGASKVAGGIPVVAEGMDIGLSVTASSAGATGIVISTNTTAYGIDSLNTGSGPAVMGRNQSAGGTGVYGQQSWPSNTGAAVYGANFGGANTGKGVYGTNNSAGGVGVYGQNLNGKAMVAEGGTLGLSVTAQNGTGIYVRTGNPAWTGQFINDDPAGSALRAENPGGGLGLEVVGDSSFQGEGYFSGGNVTFATRVDFSAATVTGLVLTAPISLTSSSSAAALSAFNNTVAGTGVYGQSIISGGTGVHGRATVAGAKAMLAEGNSLGVSATASSAVNGVAGHFASVSAVVAVSNVAWGRAVKATNTDGAANAVAIEALATGTSGIGLLATASSGAGTSKGIIASGGHTGISSTGGSAGTGTGVYAAGAIALDADGPLDVRGKTGIGVPSFGTGRIFFDSTTNKFRVSESGGPYTDLVLPSGAFVAKAGDSMSGQLSINGSTAGLSATASSGSAGLFYAPAASAYGLKVDASGSGAIGMNVNALGSGGWGLIVSADGLGLSVTASSGSARAGYFAVNSSSPALQVNNAGASHGLQAYSEFGSGVHATSNNGAGVQGITNALAADMSGVLGQTAAGTFRSYGVQGAALTGNTANVGVLGTYGTPSLPTAYGGAGVGGAFINDIAGGWGLYARSNGTGLAKAAVIEGAAATGLSVTSSNASGTAAFIRASTTTQTLHVLNDSTGDGARFSSTSGLGINAVSSGGTTGVPKAALKGGHFGGGTSEGYGVWGVASTANPSKMAGVYGEFGSPAAPSFLVSGGGAGVGVAGANGAASGIGVYGQALGASGQGVQAYGGAIGLSATATGAAGIGGHFTANTAVAARGAAVGVSATAIGTGNVFAVHAQGAGSNAVAYFGNNGSLAASSAIWAESFGPGYGLYTNVQGGIGVFGKATLTAGVGVWGKNIMDGTAMIAEGGAVGLSATATSASGNAIFARNSAGTGDTVRAINDGGGSAVSGQAISNGSGIYGQNSSTGYGVQGYNSSTGYGVYSSAPSGTGVFASGSIAGRFNGTTSSIVAEGSATAISATSTGTTNNVIWASGTTGENAVRADNTGTGAAVYARNTNAAGEGVRAQNTAATVAGGGAALFVDGLVKMQNVGSMTSLPIAASLTTTVNGPTGKITFSGGGTVSHFYINNSFVTADSVVIVNWSSPNNMTAAPFAVRVTNGAFQASLPSGTGIAPNIGTDSLQFIVFNK